MDKFLERHDPIYPDRVFCSLSLLSAVTPERFSRASRFAIDMVSGFPPKAVDSCNLVPLPFSENRTRRGNRTGWRLEVAPREPSADRPPAWTGPRRRRPTVGGTPVRCDFNRWWLGRPTVSANQQQAQKQCDFMRLLGYEIARNNKSTREWLLRHGLNNNSLSLTHISQGRKNHE